MKFIKTYNGRAINIDHVRFFFVDEDVKHRDGSIDGVAFVSASLVWHRDEYPTTIACFGDDNMTREERNAAAYKWLAKLVDKINSEE